MTDQAAENRRVCWHSRRGMLELDLVLSPFAKEVYPTLSATLQAQYRKLLACEDVDLFAWFMRRSKPEDKELSDIVEFVLSHNGPSADCAESFSGFNFLFVSRARLSAISFAVA